VMGIPAKVVRPVDQVLRDRIQSTIDHYVKLAERHRSGEVSKRAGG